MPVIPREGLVVELLLNGSADDTSGHGHHGVVHGAAPTTDRFGNLGAYLFDGTDDYIVIVPPPELGDKSLSVSLWARVDSLDLDGWSNCFICQDNGDDQDQSRRIFQLSLDRGRIVWHRMIGARDPASPQVVTPGSWCHIAGVFEAGVHRLYVDGESRRPVTHRLWVHPEEPVYIGRKGTPEPYFFFHGALDDVRMYNRALDSEEVLALFGEGGYQKARDVPAAAPISGVWETDEGLRLELRFDGERAVTGAVPAGRPGNLAAIRSGTFDRQTQALRLEGEAMRPDRRSTVRYAIEGTLERSRLQLSYRFGDDQGSTTLHKVTRWRAVRRRAGAFIGQTGRRLEPIIGPMMVPFVRALRGLRRPSKATNARRLRDRGETTGSLIFRDATPVDIPALAALHVTTWSATYPGVRRPPTHAIREWQWREAFAKADGSWFCILIENTKGELVGFAKGIKHANGSGDLNKIYLLGEYQRMGLGRRLVGHVVRRFLSSGISSMTLSADAANPSCLFYLALGAENPRDDRGRVERGSFIWRDLPALALICPVEPPNGQ
jgi:ribosomal protein S18 acetylase RimI-like enzyme